MPENEFEKQVQQKMEEFRIRPSAEVWTAVEQRIREKKRRRFILWWPLLLIGGGIAAGVLLLNGPNVKKEPLPAAGTETVTAPSAVTTPSPAKNAKEEIATDHTETKNITTIGQENTAAETKAGTKVKPGLRQPGVKPGKPNTVTAKSFLQKTAPQEQVQGGQGGKKTKRSVTAPENQSVPAETDKTATGEPATTLIKPAAPNAGVQPVMTTMVSAKTPTPDSTGKADDKAAIAKGTAPVKNDSAAQTISVNIPGKEKKKQAWQRSLTFSLGRSTVVDSAGLGFFRGNSVADMYVSGGGGSGTTPGLSRFVGPSTVYNSTSFSAGMQWSKKINRKLEWQLGAGYTYLSSRIKVGNRADSSRFINNSLSANLVTRDYFRYDSTGRTNNYHNQYHFISLSAGLSLRVVQGKKFSLAWVNNLAYRQLLFSTMLHYDGTIPGYYKDNSLLNRNQFFFTTGASVAFQKGFALEPYFSYGFTPVLKKGNGTAKHFADVGIRFSLLLNKK